MGWDSLAPLHQQHWGARETGELPQGVPGPVRWPLHAVIWPLVAAHTRCWTSSESTCVQSGAWGCMGDESQG